MEIRIQKLAKLKMYNEGTGWVMIEAELEKRQSRLNRQIEEGIYNIKPEDYDE